MKLFYQYLFNLVGLLPKKKTVVFESFHGKQYSCNPRAIYEYMRTERPEFQLIWSVDARFVKEFQQREIPYVVRFSLQWLLLLPRSKYWVINSRLPQWIKKPKHTTYVQTWHGTPLKKLGVDIAEVHMPGTTTEKYKQNFLSESKKWDYLLSPNAYSSPIFKRAFGFRGKMLEYGYPRNDYLINCNDNNMIQETRQKLGIPAGKKVILYAPTWRDNAYYEKGKYKFTLPLDLDLLKQQLGDQYVIILRMHYLVSEAFDLADYQGFVFDHSSYEDIRELYLISDLLITDYSSVMFDYILLNRPIILFTYDIEEYRDTLRGFYFDIEHESPGPLVKTTAELVKIIQSNQLNEWIQSAQYQHFKTRFSAWETGLSSQRVVEHIFQK